MNYNAKSNSNGLSPLPSLILGLAFTMCVPAMCIADGNILTSPLAMSRAAWELNRQKQEQISSAEKIVDEQARRDAERRQEERLRVERQRLEKEREKKRIEAERLDDIRQYERVESQRLANERKSAEMARARAQRDYAERTRRRNEK